MKKRIYTDEERKERIKETGKRYKINSAANSDFLRFQDEIGLHKTDDKELDNEKNMFNYILYLYNKHLKK